LPQQRTHDRPDDTADSDEEDEEDGPLQSVSAGDENFFVRLPRRIASQREDEGEVAVAAAGLPPNYFELYKKFGFDLQALAGQCRTFLDSTEQLHEKIADKLSQEGASLSRPA
jgi:hypothetical protein